MNKILPVYFLVLLFFSKNTQSTDQSKEYDAKVTEDMNCREIWKIIRPNFQSSPLSSRQGDATPRSRGIAAPRPCAKGRLTLVAIPKASRDKDGPNSIVMLCSFHSEPRASFSSSIFQLRLFLFFFFFPFFSYQIDMWFSITICSWTYIWREVSFITSYRALSSSHDSWSF